MKRLALILACSLALSAPAQEAKAPSHLDGGWWKTKSEVYREAWVGGYKNGWHQAQGHDTNLSPFGAIEIRDGVNKFYADFRNRNISVYAAIQYVADQLSGVPDDKLNAEILKLRAASVAAPTE